MLWTGDESGRIYRVDPGEGSYEQVSEIDAWALGLCLDGDGLVYVCAYDRGTIVRVDPSNGETEVYAGDVGLPNWAVFAADGTLYVSDSGSEDPSVVAGRVSRSRRVAAGRAAAAPAPRLRQRHGARNRWDALRCRELRRPVRRGREKRRRGNVCRPPPAPFPDGLALDDEGGMIVTSYQPNRVLRIPPGGGEPTILLDDWQGQSS